MKIIAIDAGNTHLRLAKIDTQNLQNIEIIHSDYYGIFAIVKNLQYNGNIPIAIASVVPNSKHLYAELVKKYTVYFCEKETVEGLRIDYSQTLGIDRIVDAVAALELFPNRDLIIIDSGTATTVDCVNSNREFLGGFILPGIKITAEAIHEKTAVLPECDPFELEFHELPKDTFSAVSSGLIADCAGGIEYAIDFCSEKLTAPQILGCGGGWEIINKFVRRKTVTIPGLTLIGTAIAGEKNITNRRNLQSNPCGDFS